MTQPQPEVSRQVALVLAGGVALGAYAAGAYAALHETPAMEPSWVCGSSIGAVTAALIAGNPPDRRIPALRAFWEALTVQPWPGMEFWLGANTAGPARAAQNLASAMQTLFAGRAGLFRPRLALAQRAGPADVSALYDLAPLRRQLVELIDFDLLNSGATRLTIAATDITSGERVVFDTGAGCHLGPEHIMASCALLPLFAPIELDGRLLGDGGLSSNAPLDLVLDGPCPEGMVCVVVDLFAAEGQRPRSLGASMSRAGDLTFGNQSRRLLEAQAREHRLRDGIATLATLIPPDARQDPAIAAILAEGEASRPRIVYLGYRAGLDEAGALKTFDFSRATLRDRWEAGEREMAAKLAADLARQ